MSLADRRHRLRWLILGGVGFLAGILLFFLARNDTLRHLALLLTIASPVAAFWRAMKPALAPHCPRPFRFDR